MNKSYTLQLKTANSISEYFNIFNEHIVYYIRAKNIDILDKYIQYVNNAGILDVYERFILWLYDKNITGEIVNELTNDIKNNLHKYTITMKKQGEEVTVLNVKNNNVLVLLHEFINKYLIPTLK